MDGFTATGLAWLILGLFGYGGTIAFDKATHPVPVVTYKPCLATLRHTGQVQFWKSTKGWGMIKSENGENVYALWYKLTEGQQLHRGENVMFDVDRSHSSGKPSAVNLKVC